MQVLPAAPRAAQNIVEQRLRRRSRLAAGIDKYCQGIVSRQERFTSDFVDFMDPCAAHFADLANPAHDLDLIVIAGRTKIFDFVASLENHPVSSAHLLPWMV